MPKPAPLYGAYIGLETAQKSFSVQAGGTSPLNSNQQASLLRHLNSASRAFERDTQRFFLPYLTTNLYRWPQFQMSSTWTLWTEEDILAVTLLQVAATGINAVPITLTNYFLEPQYAGPPYNRIEVDLSSQDVFQSGPTPQRSVSITGQWGYNNATVAAGTVSGLSVGTPTTCTVSSAALIDTGDVILIDAEAMYVSAGGVTGPTLVRGVNGTLVTTHADATPISKYVAPAPIADIVLNDALAGYEHEQQAYLPSAWGNTQNGAPLGASGAGRTSSHVDRWLETVEQYERARSAAI